MTVFDLMAKIGLDTSGYDSGLAKAKEKFSAFGSGVTSGAKSIATATLNAAKKAGELGAALLKSSVSAGANFDASMAQVASTMGKTVDEIQDLREFAQKMGAETVFSASQAAEALNYMALAGYDASKSMEMLPAVLDLAASGGIDLARASDMVTDAQSALGLSTEETFVMIDQLAKTASTTNTSVEQLGDAILTVGANAKTVKGGTQEITQVLGLLADASIKGSEGGTHLRNILLQMTPKTDAAAAAWERLGVNAYDAEGNMRSLSSIFQELSAAMQGMSDQERTDTISAMFNITDLAAVNTLLDTSVDRWNAVDEAIANAEGSAKAMANTQLDNLQGDITLFKSAWEGLQIAISDKVTPALRKFVQFGSTQVSNLSKALEEGGLGGAFKYILSTIKDLGDKAKEAFLKMAPQIAAAVPTIIESLISGFEGNVKFIVGIAIALLDGLKVGITENLPTLLESAIAIVTSVSNFLRESFPQMIPALIDLVMKMGVMLSDPETLGTLIDAALAIIIALADGLIESLPELLDKAPEIVQNLVDTITENAPKLLDSAWELIKKLASGIEDNLDEIVESGGEIITSLLEGIGELAVDVYEKGKEIFNFLKDGVVEKVDEAKEWGSDMIDNFISGLEEKWENLKSKVSDIAQTIKDFIGFSEPKMGPLSNFHTYAPDMMDLFAKGIKDNKHKITSELSTALYGVENTITSVNASMRGGYGNITNNIHISGAAFANGYDTYRTAEEISRNLKQLQIRDMRAIGGY